MEKQNRYLVITIKSITLLSNDSANRMHSGQALCFQSPVTQTSREHPIHSHSPRNAGHISIHYQNTSESIRHPRQTPRFNPHPIFPMETLSSEQIAGSSSLPEQASGEFYPHRRPRPVRLIETFVLEGKSSVASQPLC